MEFAMRPFLPEDVTCLEAQRKWVIRQYAPDCAASYDELDGKLEILQTILVSGPQGTDPHLPLKLQCMGTCFGDALAQCLGMDWVICEDGPSREPALAFSGTPILIFPLSMVTQQVGEGRVDNMRDLFDGTCRRILEIKNDVVPHQ